MKFILGVCGSISAYKSLDICRGLTKAGNEVRVILTKGALEFVKPEVFRYLGASQVYLPHDDFNPQAMGQGNVLHIELSKWADQLLLAPASANTLAKLSQGRCDDLLSSIFLASPKTPTIIFPAMNTNMLGHPLTQKNLAALSGLSNVFIHPTKSGELACGDEGEGKLQDVELIIETAPVIKLDKPKKKVLLTTGATIAPLDPVRYLTNPSTGLTGYELAKSFLQMGYAVTLIEGFKSSPKIKYLKDLPHAQVLSANTTREMQALVMANIQSHDIYISSAALSDIEFAPSAQKLKKDSLQGNLQIQQAPDVLKEVIELRSNKLQPQLVGFAAETDNDTSVFLKKWKNKPVDVLVGNRVSNGAMGKAEGFGSDENQYTILKRDAVFFQGRLMKSQLAHKIAEALQ